MRRRKGTFGNRAPSSNVSLVRVFKFNVNLLTGIVGCFQELSAFIACQVHAFKVNAPTLKARDDGFPPAAGLVTGINFIGLPG